MRRAAVIVPVALALAALVGSFIPFLAEKREELAATPSPQPPPNRETPLVLQPRGELCVDGIAVPPEAERLRVFTDTYGGRGGPLALDVRGEDYRTSSRVPGGYEGMSTVEFAIDPPPRELLAAACLTNRGERGLAVFSDLEAARPSATIDGTPVGSDASVVLVKRDRSSLASRVPDVVRRVALFRPFSPWLVWMLAALVIAAVLAVPVIVHRAVASDRGPDEPA